MVNRTNWWFCTKVLICCHWANPGTFVCDNISQLPSSGKPDSSIQVQSIITYHSSVEPIGGSVPKFSSAATENVNVAQSHELALLCSAQGSPTPTFRYKILMLIYLEPIGGSTPKFSSDDTKNVFGSKSVSISLLCSAQGSPTPTFRYCTVSC